MAKKKPDFHTKPHSLRSSQIKIDSPEIQVIYSTFVTMSGYDIVEELNKKQTGMVMFLPIHSIDGIVCQGNLSLRKVAKAHMTGPEDIEKRVKLEIVSRYHFKELHVKMFEADATHQDIVDYIKSIANFKFCRLSSRLFHDKTDWKPHYEYKFMQELFSEIANDNLRTDFGDCPVCLETCYTKLECGHHLCLQCESKMTECKCPQCRAAYSRDEDEEVY